MAAIQTTHQPMLDTGKLSCHLFIFFAVEAFIFWKIAFLSVHYFQHLRVFLSGLCFALIYENVLEAPKLTAVTKPPIN